jgi:RNA polymerase sigma factor (sigma-70 family)
MTSSDLKTAEQKFGEAVSELLQSHNDAGSALLSFIQILLRRWYINDVTAEDVLHDAVEQGLRHTRKTGEEIHYPKAWLRTTSKRILQNRVRKNVRQNKIFGELTLIKPDTSEDPGLQLEWQDLLTQIAKARQILSDEDQEIFKLYFDEEKNYDQIKAYYERKDGELISLQTIRKRVSRAKQRTISAFHQLNSSPNQDGKFGQNSEKKNVIRIHQMEK